MSSETTTRQARVERKTKETEITLHLNLDGTGASKVQTPIPFFSHMLEAWSKHGLMDLAVDAQGDVEVDQHHTVEDVGIVLGQALRQALGDKRGIVRYGTAYIPMDEALVSSSVDLSGRPFLVFSVPVTRTRVSNFEDRKSTRLNSIHGSISYAVFCLKKKNKTIILLFLNSNQLIYIVQILITVGG